MYRSLLFDLVGTLAGTLVGTLAETDSLHLPTWVEALLPHGIEVGEAFYRENIGGSANDEIVGDLLPTLSTREGRGSVEAKEAGFRARAGDLEPLPGLMECLESARGRGSSPGRVTNAPRENVAAVLAALGLEDFLTPSSRQRRSGPRNRTRNRTRNPT